MLCMQLHGGDTCARVWLPGRTGGLLDAVWMGCCRGRGATER